MGRDGSNHPAHSHIHKTGRCKELRPVCQSQEGQLCAPGKLDLTAVLQDLISRPEHCMSEQQHCGFSAKAKSLLPAFVMEREHDSDSTTVAASAWDSHSAEMSPADISSKPCCFGTPQQKRAVRPDPWLLLHSLLSMRMVFLREDPLHGGCLSSLTLLSNRAGPWLRTDKSTSRSQWGSQQSALALLSQESS